MTWHATHQIEEGSMCHPFDAEAWKYFDRMYPDFAEEPHNVRLGLCTDGFAPHGQYGCTYSCWLDIITPYNLPPGMCMSSEYMFLTMVILGPSNPKRLIDVYLESLIKELPQFWRVDVRTYDHATDWDFMMRVALMWIVNDLPAYGIASGWSTTGVMRCSICMDDTRAFHLQHGGKACYFDYHRQFFPTHHSYRRNKKAFMKNYAENKIARPRLIGDQIRNWITNINPIVKISLSLPNGYGSDHKWTKKSIFWDLPCWSTLLF
ncbi:UNVERIFIED_CONTAM: hypothetical protein Sradi_6827200 [Sesamum radiatum]|uniref:Uncharacterized protein n=1 Tax=Sesamum radiatum TaxID=300843 RepID=A0AAW2JT18_SESRA